MRSSEESPGTRRSLLRFLWPLLYAYFAFVLMTWLAPSFFNLLLRLDRFGRYALSADQIRGANVLAACLAATLGCLAAALGTGSAFLLYCTMMFALLALPARPSFRAMRAGRAGRWRGSP